MENLVTIDQTNLDGLLAEANVKLEHALAFGDAAAIKAARARVADVENTRKDADMAARARARIQLLEKRDQLEAEVVRLNEQNAKALNDKAEAVKNRDEAARIYNDSVRAVDIAIHLANGAHARHFDAVAALSRFVDQNRNELALAERLKKEST
jgi:hypothetical protein